MGSQSNAESETTKQEDPAARKNTRPLTTGNDSDLTKNQQLVLDSLQGAESPLSAYDLLDNLRESGLRAPPQIYRALEKLLEFGMVHRVESLNAFVACAHPDGEVHHSSAFAICDLCSAVAELPAGKLQRQLKALAGGEEFTLQTSAIELRGTCKSCISSNNGKHPEAKEGV